jgi:hypothetical protein
MASARAFSYAGICLSDIKAFAGALRAFRYSSLLGLRTISRLSASMVSWRCSTGSRMMPDCGRLILDLDGDLTAHTIFSQNGTSPLRRV